MRGMGIYAGFEPIYVKGATGYLNTNYRGKAEAALQALTRLDFVFLHVEAPDEAGHAGNCKEKIEAIENFDRKVVGTVLEGLERFDDFRIMVVSDHLTPIPEENPYRLSRLLLPGLRKENWNAQGPEPFSRRIPPARADC